MMSPAPTAAQAADFLAPAPLTAEILGEATNIVKVGGKRCIHLQKGSHLLLRQVMDLT